MTYIGSRHLRIIPGERDANENPDTRRDASRQDFDYASLTSRRRILRRMRDVAGTRHPSDAHEAADDGDDDPLPPGSHAGSGRDGEPPDAPTPFATTDSLPENTDAARLDDGANPAYGPGGAGRDAIGAHIADASRPVVSAVLQRQQEFVALFASIAREIGSFCGDPSVAEAGNWEVQLRLDPRQLPQTTLYLSLSRFRLQLRFDTTDPLSRQLLLEHSSLLERELDAMLRAWGERRDIELTVW